jgi:predicted peptidase
VGPFPLIVFLHGYGERKIDRVFSRGLPEIIAAQFGEAGKKGRFEFVALFPNDPTGQWETGTPEVKDAMSVVDKVIRQHRIDPSRVYLTGASNGGNGVWHLAEAYPDRWAAVVPVCAFQKPDVKTVRAIPAWVFHGAEDEMASVEVARTLVQELKEADADVRYTEYPHRGHSIWSETYKSNDLYKWLASKKRP